MAETQISSASLLDSSGNQLLPNTRAELVWVRTDSNGKSESLHTPNPTPDANGDAPLSWILVRTPRLDKDNIYTTLWQKVKVGSADITALKVDASGNMTMGASGGALATIARYITDNEKIYVGGTEKIRVDTAGLHSFGGVSAKGICDFSIYGFGGGGAGTVTGITVGTTTYDPDADGKVTLPVLPLVGGTLTGMLTLAGLPTSDNHAATKKYVDDLISSLPKTMEFKGSLGTGGTVTQLPSASSEHVGWTYKVITAGTYAGQAAKVGDTFVCASEDSSYQWVLIPSGDEPSGTVTSVGLSVPTGLSVTGSPITESGTLNITFATGYSIPTTAKQVAWDNKQDALPMAGGNYDISIAGNAASATNLAGGAAGSLPYQSGTNATTFLAKGTNGQVLKLVNNLPSWADEYSYTLPLATNDARGGLKIGYSESGANLALKLSQEKGYVTLTASSVTSALGNNPVARATGDASGHNIANTYDTKADRKAADLASVEIGAIITRSQALTTPAVRFNRTDGTPIDIDRETPVDIFATNIYSQTEQTDAEFTSRTTAGDANVISKSATFKSIKGNTIVWNQSVQNGNFASKDGWLAPLTNFTVVDNEAHIEGHKDSGLSAQPQFYPTSQYMPTIIVGHKYFVSFFNRNGENDNMGCIIYRFGNNNISAEQGFERRIVTAEDASKTLLFWKYRGAGESLDSNWDFYLSRIMIFDLTQMFGAGNEPASVEEFKALFPNDYYPYNAGQLLSLAAQKFVTDGFNAFNVATGKAEVIGGLTPNTGQAGTYQITGAYTSLTLDGETITPDTNGFFTPVKSGELVVIGGDDTTCVHLVWSGVRNGEYEPYWKSEKILNLTTITGKLNGQGESVAISPDGMRSAGTVHDELIRDTSGNIVKAVKRLIAVDLGMLNWSKDSNSFWYTPDLPVGLTNLNAISSKLFYCGLASDTTIRDSIYWYRSGSGYFEVYNSTAVSSTDVKNSLNNVWLIYELAEPLTYVLDEPLDPNYRVDDFGTESIAPLTDTDGNPATAPFKADIVYGTDIKRDVERLAITYTKQTQVATNTAIGLVGLGHVSTDDNHQQASLAVDADGKGYVVTQLGYKDTDIILPATPNFD